jgi:DNA-binding XRE family transcriptional regulator
MNAPTNVQIISGPDGKPAFAVIPYSDFVKCTQNADDIYIPHEVVAMMVDRDWSIARAWREHLGLTQEQVAERMGVTQSAYSQQESSRKIRAATRRKIAAALGILPAQLDV